MARQRRMKWLAIVCRVVLGVVFVFSGLMKLNDAWGATNTVANYLALIGLRVNFLNVILAIGWSGVEFALGVMLLIWVWRRLVVWSTMFIMGGFTLLMLVVAIFNPLDDCGCFGEAIRMSNWLSFGKNVVLFVAAVYLWKRIKGIERVSSNWRGAIVGAVSGLLGVGLGVLSYLTLPPVDFFSFKTGANLRTDIVCSNCMDAATVLIYRNLDTGDLQEFALSDTTYYDASKWTWVETRTATDDLTPSDYERDFAIYDGQTNMAAQIINSEGVTALFVVRDIDKLTPRKLMWIDSLMLANQDALPIIVTILDRNNPLEINNIEGLPVWQMDAKTLGMLLRADFGVVWIENGIITGKRHLL